MLRSPDHRKYTEAVRSRAIRQWNNSIERKTREARDAALNAWFHDGVIMERRGFGDWEAVP